MKNGLGMNKLIEKCKLKLTVNHRVNSNTKLKQRNNISISTQKTV